MHTIWISFIQKRLKAGVLEYIDWLWIKNGNIKIFLISVAFLLLKCLQLFAQNNDHIRESFVVHSISSLCLGGEWSVGVVLVGVRLSACVLWTRLQLFEAMNNNIRECVFVPSISSLCWSSVGVGVGVSLSLSSAAGGVTHDVTLVPIISSELFGPSLLSEEKEMGK